MRDEKTIELQWTGNGWNTGNGEEARWCWQTGGTSRQPSHTGSGDVGEGTLAGTLEQAGCDDRRQGKLEFECSPQDLENRLIYRRDNEANASPLGRRTHVHWQDYYEFHSTGLEDVDLDKAETANLRLLGRRAHILSYDYMIYLPELIREHFVTIDWRRKLSSEDGRIRGSITVRRRILFGEVDGIWDLASATDRQLSSDNPTLCALTVKLHRYRNQRALPLM